jgi:imidazolonepropionase-like amidohydrolase
MIQRYRAAYAHGVKFACGTDAGTPGNPHGSTASELRAYVEKIGMTTGEALQTATINAARAIKKDHLLGSIQVGKLADMVVVDGNPLSDISLLENYDNLLYVIKNGIIMAKQGVLVPLDRKNHQIMNLEANLLA